MLLLASYIGTKVLVLKYYSIDNRLQYISVFLIKWINYNQFSKDLMKNRFTKVPKVSHIAVNVSTWEKDSHGLYDYQAPPQTYKKETYYLENQCKIYRNTQNDKTIIKIGNQIKTRSDSNTEIATLLINRENVSNPFQLYPIKQSNQLNDQGLQPFIVVHKDFIKDTVQGYPLQAGTIIKLGRVEYMVIEVRNNQQVQTLRDTKHFEDTTGTFIPERISKKQTTQEELNCKVCFCEGDQEQNPLISPCNCKGSCQMIHVGCLRTWINMKVKKEVHSNLTVSYNFTKFECEICKYPFPKIVKIGEKEIQMMTITKPDRPYIIIESLKAKGQMKQEKYLHLISADEGGSVKIGRGHTSQIRVTDISVSRVHAEILFQNNRFYLRDLNSKFGTLVMFNEGTPITSDAPLKLQFGRTVFDFTVEGQPLEVDTQ